MRQFTLVLLALLLCVTISYADIVTLKNGNVLRGKIVKETKKEIVIQVAFGKLTIARKKIAVIKREKNEINNIIYQAKRQLKLKAIDNALRYLEQQVKKRPEEKRLRKALAGANLYAARYYRDRGEIIKTSHHASIAAKSPHLEIKAQIVLSDLKKRHSEAKTLENKGKLLLSQGKFQRSVEIYLTLLEKYPEWEGQIAKTLAQAALFAGRQNHAKNLDRAIYYYELALEFHSEYFPAIEPFWLHAKIRKILEESFAKKRWGDAQRDLKDILEVSPNCKPALYLLAYTYDIRQEYYDAYRCYQRMLNRKKNWSGDKDELVKIRSLARKNSQLQFQPTKNENSFHDEENIQGDWSVMRTDHFIVYYYNAKVAKKVADLLEYHWYQIPKQLAHDSWNDRWRMPCKVYIHPSKQHFTASAGVMAWGEGVTRIRASSGKLYSHAIHVYQSAPLLFTSILPHEVTHVFFAWFMGYRGRYPLWLEEGVAMLSEPKFRQINRIHIIRSALRKGNYIPLKQLLSARSYPQSEIGAGIFYAQSFSLVYFLWVRFGKDNLYYLAQNCRKQSAAKAILSTYSFANLQDLEQQWINFVLEYKSSKYK